jgi:hypothetical protein
MAAVSPCTRQATPAAPLPAPSGAFEISSDSKESIIMPAETVRRVRHSSRTSEADRKNAAAALQRALDRRDNGGSTGH